MVLTIMLLLQMEMSLLHLLMEVAPQQQVARPISACCHWHPPRNTRLNLPREGQRCCALQMQTRLWHQVKTMPMTGRLLMTATMTKGALLPHLAGTCATN